MKCVTCGHETEYDFRFCPNCGAAAAPVVLAQTGVESHPTAYIRADYDPSRDGRMRQQAASQPYTPYAASRPAPDVSSQPGSGGYRPAESSPVAATAADNEPRPSTTAQIVLASINIIFVGLGISFILGIIALVFTIMASGETVVSEAWNKLRTAKTLNIIGLVFLAIQLLIIIIMITAGIVMFVNVFSQTGPTFGGDYPLG